jgi:hypothetical protein
MSVTESDEVLVARIVSGATMESSSRKICFFGAEGDPAEELGLLLLGHLLAGDRAAGRVLEVLTAALDALVVLLDTDDLEALAREHLGDTGAHRAETDDPDRLEGARGRGGLCSGVSHAVHPI